MQPDQVVVVEDSSNGLRAALGAGLACVVTVSTYTVDEDFTGAALVVSSLGDPDGERATVLADPLGIRPGAGVRLADLSTVLGRWRPEGPVPGDQQADSADPVKEKS